jgi:hypothetical protein
MADPITEAYDALKAAEKADRTAANNPTSKNFREAAGAWSKAGELYRSLVENGEVDWCTVAEAYLHCARDLEAMAAQEKDAGAVITILKEVARVFDKAADLFLKCGDAAMRDDDYSRAIGAYAKAAYGYGRRAITEQKIADYYGALLKKNPNDGVAAGQTEQAQNRKKDAEKQRDKAKQKQQQARQKFLD